MIRLIAFALAFVYGDAMAQRKVQADVPWTGATTCQLVLTVSQSPTLYSGTTTIRSFPVTVDNARGLQQYGYRVCVDDPAQWGPGFYLVSLRLRRDSDGAISDPAVGRFGGPPRYMLAPTDLRAH